MYELAEYAFAVLVAVMVWAISFVVVATFLVVAEGVKATNRRLRAR